MVLEPSLAEAWHHSLPLIRPVQVLAETADARVVLGETAGQYVVVKCLFPRRGRRGHASREVEVLQAAQGPHVVRLFDVARSDTCTFVVMEQLRNGTLRDTVGLTWTAVDLVAAGLGVTAALARLHRSSVLFNDFKPRNVGLGANDGRLVAKLIDFGHARSVADTRANRFIGGSLDYAPPELVREGQLGTWSDVWAWGRSWHLLATGDYFGRVVSINQLFRDGRMPLPPVAQVSKEPLPWSLATLIDDAVTLDSSQRPPDAGEVHSRLLAVAREEWGGIDRVRAAARFAGE